MPIYSRLEEISARVYGEKVMPLVINKLGVDCEVFRGSTTTSEYSFYGPESGHSPTTFIPEAAERFETRLMITGNEVFKVEGYNIGSSTSHALVYAYKWIKLLTNDYIRVNRHELKERWFKIVDPEVVGMTISILDCRYTAVSVEGIE
jgi:hypothetical protein